MLLAPCSSAHAQQPKKVPGIGYLSGSSLSAAAARVAAFQQGLRDLGYVEGKNIVIEWRSGEGKLDRNLAHAAVLSPVWRGREAILLDWPPFARS
jgi:putative tryptophan/tyrosine transport system substrate-binding protein